MLIPLAQVNVPGCPACLPAYAQTTHTPTPENHPGFPAWNTKKLKTKIVQPISQK
jgi:hypothetical protein